jgi:hypothetical protein
MSVSAARALAPTVVDVIAQVMIIAESSPSAKDEVVVN